MSILLVNFRRRGNQLHINLIFFFFSKASHKTNTMQISRFISGGVTEVVQGLLQAQKAVALYGVELKTAYTKRVSPHFDLAVSTRSNHDKGGD